jgi:hypothetical protein
LASSGGREAILAASNGSDEQCPQAAFEADFKHAAADRGVGFTVWAEKLRKAVCVMPMAFSKRVATASRNTLLSSATQKPDQNAIGCQKDTPG